MILPFMGLITFIVTFYFIGRAVLNIIPSFKDNKINRVIFLFGAWVGVVLAGVMFTMLTDAKGNLTSTVSVLSYLISMPISGICIGILFVFLCNKIFELFKSKY